MVLRETIEAIQKHQPVDRPYYGLFSGGKDSVVLKHVAHLAGADVEWFYNVTTIDPPELVRFIRENHPDVKWLRPKKGPFWIRAAEIKGFPTRHMRWCCDDYKERKAPAGSTMLMGIRAQESPKRAASWGIYTEHHKTKTMVVNPLIHWDAEDLWEFIRDEGIKYCSLYDEGFTRLGCVGCPMSPKKNREREFERWPRYKDKWQKIFRRTWERRTGTLQRDGRPWFGDAFFDNWQEMWDWWLSNKSLPSRGQDNQGTIDTGGDR